MVHIAKALPTEGANYRLLGARYCSLQGSIACQVKLARPDGSVSTLYLVRDGREFSGVREGTQRVQNLEIELWREDGLLVGFASASR